jgi:hypothetical protein
LIGVRGTCPNNVAEIRYALPHLVVVQGDDRDAELWPFLDVDLADSRAARARLQDGALEGTWDGRRGNEKVEQETDRRRFTDADISDEGDVVV